MAKRPKDAAGGKGRDEFLVAVGHRIKVARTRAGLTQKDLAALLSTAQSWVYLAEDGQQNLQLVSLRRLALALGVEARDLLPDAGGGADPDAAREIEAASAALVRLLAEAVGQAHRLRALSGARPLEGRAGPAEGER